MLHQKVYSASPIPPRVERRKDYYTRAVVGGLQELSAEIERLPNSEVKVVALAAVAKYARNLAVAIERKKRDDAESTERAKARIAEFSGSKFPVDTSKGSRPPVR